MLRFNCSASFSLTTRFTLSSQLGRRGIGHLASLIPQCPPNQLNSPPNLQSSAFSTNTAAKALRSVNWELLQSFVQDPLERFIVAILVKNRVSLITTI